VFGLVLVSPPNIFVYAFFSGNGQEIESLLSIQIWSDLLCLESYFGCLVKNENASLVKNSNSSITVFELPP
jgi:hypothetical protein